MSIVNIFSKRIGHATNSSSSHSIIKLKEKGLELVNRYSSRFTDDHDLDYSDSDAVLRSREEKLDYLITNFVSVLRQVKPDYQHDLECLSEGLHELRDELLKVGIPEVVNLDLTRFLGTNFQYTKRLIPIYNALSDYYSTPDLHYGFYAEYFKYVIDSTDIIIHIWHDNWDTKMPELIYFAGDDKDNPYEDTDFLNFIHEYDENTVGNYFVAKRGKYWVMFSKYDGYKIRFSFQTEEPFTKTTCPELMDIKITNMCHANCEFCYQNSTCEGKHANVEDLRDIFSGLKSMGLFEVVLGGGEPLEHPRLATIINSAKNCKFNVALTTRRHDLLFEEIDRIANDNPSAMWANLTAIGVSIRTPAELQKFIDKEQELWDRRDKNIRDNENFIFYDAYSNATDFISKFKYHLVMGTISKEDFEAIVTTAKERELNLLLLGYKTTGRAGDKIPIDYPWWLDVISKAEIDAIGIDTSMAKRFQTELEEHGVDAVTYEVEEGKFSCYIDAVEMTISSDSYSGHRAVSLYTDDIRPLDFSPDSKCCGSRDDRLGEKILEEFAKF